MVETANSILVIDDDYDIRDAICLALSAENYVVQVAPSREAGWLLIQQQPPAVILLDWYMPGMSLEEFVANMQGSYPTTQIVLISAANGLVSKAGEMKLHYLPKPFEIMTLLQVVRERLEARKN